MPGCLVIGLNSSLIPEVILVAASVIKGVGDARLLFCWVRDRYYTYVWISGTVAPMLGNYIESALLRSGRDISFA